MSDSPAETLLFDGARHAHTIRPALSPLWIIAGLLGLINGLLLIVLIGGR